MSFSTSVRIIDAATKIMTDHIDGNPALAFVMGPCLNLYGILPMVGQYLHLCQNREKPLILPGFQPFFQELGADFERSLDFAILHAPRVLEKHQYAVRELNGPLAHAIFKCSSFETGEDKRTVACVDLDLASNRRIVSGGVTPIYPDSAEPFFPRPFFSALARHALAPRKILMPDYVEFSTDPAPWAECLRLSTVEARASVASA